MEAVYSYLVHFRVYEQRTSKELKLKRLHETSDCESNCSATTLPRQIRNNLLSFITLWYAYLLLSCTVLRRWHTVIDSPEKWLLWSWPKHNVSVFGDIVHSDKTVHFRAALFQQATLILDFNCDTYLVTFILSNKICVVICDWFAFGIICSRFSLIARQLLPWFVYSCTVILALFWYHHLITESL